MKTTAILLPGMAAVVAMTALLLPLHAVQGFTVHQQQRDSSLRPSSSWSSSSLTTTTTSTRRFLSSAVETPSTSSRTTEDDTIESSNDKKLDTASNMPELGPDGLYHIANKKQHRALIEANSDKIVVMKVFAPWCRACKGMHPKFMSIVNDDKFSSKNLPIVYAELSIQHNKDFVKSLGILALPTVQFYVAGKITDTFPCGPSKIAILKRKLAQVINRNVCARTRRIKREVLKQAREEASAAAVADDPDREGDAPSITATTPKKVPSSGILFGRAAPVVKPENPVVSDQERIRLREIIPYFKSMSLADYDTVMDKARLLTFEPGSILMREGRKGRTFYILKEGELEICQKAIMAEDPLTTPSSYLGTVINRLVPNDYFGERALISGEPRAASIRAAYNDEKVVCWALDRDDFPPSSILSGKTKGITDVAEMELVNDKYGVSFMDLYDSKVNKQILDSSTASQVRGSANSPRPILGVDTDDDADAAIAASQAAAAAAAASLGALEDLDAASTAITEDAGGVVADGAAATTTGATSSNEGAIFNLLTRFQLIRLVGRCFHYIIESRAVWGQEGVRKRRNVLVGRLTRAQRSEFKDAFKLIDASGDGNISLLELKRVMESIGETMSDEELQRFIATGAVGGGGGGGGGGTGDHRQETMLNMDDFMGIMAEAEFYYLFRDIFSSLDPNETGFVKADDLNRVLNGVHDLIDDEQHHSLLDTHSGEDTDMLIDYEQFSRMLLGSALV